MKDAVWMFHTCHPHVPSLLSAHKANDTLRTLPCPSWPFSQVDTQSGMSSFRTTPLACPKLSLRDLAQLKQICIAGFMPIQLGERVVT